MSTKRKKKKQEKIKKHMDDFRKNDDRYDSDEGDEDVQVTPCTGLGCFPTKATEATKVHPTTKGGGRKTRRKRRRKRRKSRKMRKKTKHRKKRKSHKQSKRKRRRR